MKGEHMIDRVEEWEIFSKHMRIYVREHTINKYATHDDVQIDLMQIMGKNVPIICCFNAIKYCIRMLNGSGKRHDIFKVVHYMQILWEYKNRTGEDNETSSTM